MSQKPSQTPPRILKVLLLEKYADHLPDLSARGITTEVTQERAWNHNLYEANEKTLAKIKELTASKNFDIVVLGNNLGAGIVKAASIHPRLHSRTVVVWNDDGLGGKAEYEKLGFRNFMTRDSLEAYITKLVTN